MIVGETPGYDDNSRQHHTKVQLEQNRRVRAAELSAKDWEQSVNFRLNKKHLKRERDQGWRNPKKRKKVPPGDNLNKKIYTFHFSPKERLDPLFKRDFI